MKDGEPMSLNETSPAVLPIAICGSTYNVDKSKEGTLAAKRKTDEEEPDANKKPKKEHISSLDDDKTSDALNCGVACSCWNARKA